MSYVVYAGMAQDMASWGVRFQSCRILYRVCRAVVTWLFLPVAYFGALLAPAVVFALPIQVLHSFHVAPPSLTFWSSVGLLSACAIWLLCRFGSAAIHGIRQRVVHVDALVGFFGIALAIACHAWLISRRGGF
jgi:hypothetical protein